MVDDNIKQIYTEHGFWPFTKDKYYAVLKDDTIVQITSTKYAVLLNKQIKHILGKEDNHD